MNKPMKRFLLVLMTLWVISNQGLAQVEPDFIAVSSVLFPESRSLPLFSSYPSLSAGELAGVKNSLATAFRAKASGQSFLEGQGCSFSERVFEAGDPAGFRRFDLNGDGFPDIVYSGSALCAEGDGTVIWLGSPDGYTLDEPAMWPLLLLRVAPDGKKTISVERGCCGAITDTYAFGNYQNFRQNEVLQITRELQLPAHLLLPRTFAVVRQTKLRATPVVRDAYNDGKSYFLGHATFGNTVRTYMAGARGRILGESEGKERWIFVVMNPASDALVLQDPYRGVRAGWLPAGQIRRVK